MQKQKILIVEDNAGMRSFLKAEVKDGIMDVRVFEADSIDEARGILLANPDISTIVMDACVPGVEINTIPLVHEIREVFHFGGVMMAASSNPDFRKQLMDAGCNCDAPKDRVHELLVDVLRAA